MIYFENFWTSPLLYQSIFAILFVVFLNKLLTTRFKEQIIPLIPRVLYVRNEQTVPNSSPILFERLKEFFNDLQQKRNAILAGIFPDFCITLELKNGSMIAEAAIAKVKELCEVEKHLNQIQMFNLRIQRFNQSKVRLYFNNAKKVFNTFLSILMKIN
jgi:hypothetical protein